MDKLGLRGNELRAYHDALADDHSVRIRASVLNLEHDRIASIDHQIDEGQVDVTSSGEVTRSTQVTFSDEARAISFDSDSPANGALFADRQIQLEYGIHVPSIGWVDASIFTGPIFGLSRSAGRTIITAQGKESLARAPVTAWEPMHIKKGTPKVVAIRRIMRERCGENRFDLPDLPARLPKGVSLDRMSEPWLVCQKIAQSMDKQLYYNGAGRLCLREMPGNPVFGFRDGTGGTIASDAPPQVDFNITDVRNLVWVKGGKPKATRRKNETRAEFEERQDKERGIRYHKVAPHSHPLSPWRLGRPDAPRFMPHVIENDQVRSEKEARKLADRVLHDMLMQHVDIQMGVLPIPHLEVLDLARVRTDLYDFTFRLKEFSIPLRVGTYMTVGSNRKLRPRGRHGHGHGHRH